jgi:hypothetical protein
LSGATNPLCENSILSPGLSYQCRNCNRSRATRGREFSRQTDYRRWRLDKVRPHLREFPNWSGDHSISVAEIINGQPKTFPNDEWNKPGPASSHFVWVQSVVVDDQDNLWVLDPPAQKMQEIVKGGPKLVKIDLATNQIVQTIPSGEDVATKKSYLNDVNERKTDEKTIVDDVQCCARAPVRPECERQERDCDDIDDNRGKDYAETFAFQ